MSMKMSFEELLNRDGKLTYTNVGESMYPMLRSNKDVFTIAKKTHERLKVNDVALFKLHDKYLMHRVVEVRGDSYTMLGDNCAYCEKNIKDDDILGVLVAFQRNGRVIKTDDRLYLLYVFVVRFFEKPRIIIKKTVMYIRKTIKRFL